MGRCRVQREFTSTRYSVLRLLLNHASTTLRHQIYSLDDHKAALLTSLTADLVGLTRAADNRLHLSMTSGRASWSLNKTDVNGDAASGRGKKVYSCVPPSRVQSKCRADLSLSSCRGTLGSFSGPPVWSALSTSASPTGLIEVITTASHFNIALSPTGSPLKDLLTLSIDEEAEYASVLASAGDQALGEVFVGDCASLPLALRLASLG